MSNGFILTKINHLNLVKILFFDDPLIWHNKIPYCAFGELYRWIQCYASPSEQRESKVLRTFDLQNIQSIILPPSADDLEILGLFEFERKSKTTAPQEALKKEQRSFSLTPISMLYYLINLVKSDR